MVGMRTAERMQHIPFFANVKENKPWSKLGLLGGMFQFEEVPKGETCFRQGNPADKFYIIIRGSVEVSAQGKEGTISLGRLLADDW